MTINIEKEIDYTFDFNEEEVINSVVISSLDYVKCPYEACVNVIITDNDGIQGINKEFRNMDKPTDVLSFPMVDYTIPGNFDHLEEDSAFDCFDPDSGELLLGDIILSVDRIYSQAEEYGHSTKRELAFLVAHSMFHLFGYDHMTPEEETIMKSCQEDVLVSLNIIR